MRTKHETVTWPECEGEIKVDYYPGSPAQTYGPPERCDPGDPDYLDHPGNCPHCKYEITEEDEQRWADDFHEEYREMEREGRRHRGYRF